MAKVFVFLLLLVSTVAAESRFKIHPTDGEFVRTEKACGEKTKDELFDKIIKRVPVLVIGKDKMSLELKEGSIVADKVLNDTGWWNYYVGKLSSKTMIITLEPTKTKFRVISIGIVMKLDELVCSEKWVGLVEVPRGR